MPAPKKTTAKKAATKKRAPAKKPVGAPSKYKPEMCKIVIEMGRKGASLTEMAVACGVLRQTLHEWINPEHTAYKPDFGDAVQIAREASQAWWEAKSRDMLEDDVIPTPAGGYARSRYSNAAILNFQMQCRFPNDYRPGSKQEIEAKVEGGVLIAPPAKSPDEWDAEG